MFELSLVRFHNSLSLLDAVVLNVAFTFVVVLVGFFVQHNLMLSLVEKSFSHVLILMHSSHFVGVHLDHAYEFLVCFFFFLGVVMRSWSACFLELALQVEEILDVVFSCRLNVLVNLGFGLRIITILVSVRINSSADLLT